MVIVPADPDHAQPVTGKAGEPAVAKVVGGAGLARNRQCRRQPGRQTLRRSLPYHVLQGHGEQIEQSGVDHLLDFQRVSLQRLAIGRQHFANRPQRRAETTGGNGLVNRGSPPGATGRWRPAGSRHRRAAHGRAPCAANCPSLNRRPVTGRAAQLPGCMSLLRRYTAGPGRGTACHNSAASSPRSPPASAPADCRPGAWPACNAGAAGGR